jgi:hypothetical protein
MQSKIRLLIVAAIAAAVAIFVKRPVKPPAADGAWHPADHQPTNR